MATSEWIDSRPDDGVRFVIARLTGWGPNQYEYRQGPGARWCLWGPQETARVYTLDERTRIGESWDGRTWVRVEAGA